MSAKLTLDEFLPVPTEAWDEVVRQDLKGATPKTRLFYRAEDLQGLEYLESAPGEFPYTRGTRPNPDWQPFSRPADAAREVTIQAHRFAESGGTIVQELAYALAEGVDFIAERTSRGVSPDEAARALAFSFSIGPQYFPEIAKLRAARTLWARAVECFHPKDLEAGKMVIYARTAHWNETIYDPYVNVLRATTEAMAAVIGGADAVEVEEFDATYREPSAESRRLARNTQLILQQEARLDRAVDAAGGSYYLENLTDALARDAWKLFQEIEAAGGFGKYAASGALEAALARSRAERKKSAATRRLSMVGTNQYPNPRERMLPAIERVDRAPRTAAIFEAIRLRTERYAARTGRTPRILLFEAGDAKMRKARSGFCANFFGCAGFEIQTAEAMTGDADLVVLCSSDPEYAELAPRVMGELRAAGKQTPVMVAGNPTEWVEVLKQAGVADFVHLRVNAAEFLQAWQVRLGVSE